MKINKLFIAFLSALLIVLCTAATAFAEDNPVLVLRDALEKVGVPSSQLGNVVEYLQKVNITQAQADTVIAKIDSAYAKTGGQTDLTKLSQTGRDEIKVAMADAFAFLGLTADFSQKDSKGATALSIVDKDGSILISTSTTNEMVYIKNFDVNALKEAVNLAVFFSNNVDKRKYNPVTGAKMTTTGTEYGDLIGIGMLLVIGSIGLYIFGKRKMLKA